MLDVTQVEAGIIYVKETDGSYSVVEPTNVGFGHVSFPNVSTRAELRMHLHHNYVKPTGEKGHPVPSPQDIVSFVTLFSRIYNLSKRDKFTDILTTRNGLYAFRCTDTKKIIDFYNSLSDDIRDEIEEIYEEEIMDLIDKKIKEGCASGCTEEQRLQIRNFNADKGFVKLINKVNKKYDTGIGLFKGILNTEANNYDWQKVSD